MPNSLNPRKRLTKRQIEQLTEAVYAKLQRDLELSRERRRFSALRELRHTKR